MERAKCDVVVIGGGIVGVTAALYMARAGLRVIVCEKGSVAGEQSKRNAGWIGRQKRDPREMELCARSLDVWREIAELTGNAVKFRQTGMVHGCETDADVAEEEEWLRVVAATEIDSRIIGRAEVSSLLKTDSHNFKAALYSPTDARADPRVAAPMIAEAARIAGAQIFENRAVRGIEKAAGKVTGVVTEDGHIACSSVIVAAGAWSRLLLASLGVTMPQLKVVTSNQRIRFYKPILASLYGPGFALSTWEDGTATVLGGGRTIHEITYDSFRFFFDFLPILKDNWRETRLRVSRDFLREWRDTAGWSPCKLTSFERHRTYAPNPDATILDSALAALARSLSLQGGFEILDRWAGYLETVPDRIPVISPVPGVAGAYVSSSSGHGFGVGPITGKMLASMVRGETPIVDPHPYRLERFSEPNRDRTVGYA